MFCTIDYTLYFTDLTMTQVGWDELGCSDSLNQVRAVCTLGGEGWVGSVFVQFPAQVVQAALRDASDTCNFYLWLF